MNALDVRGLTTEFRVHGRWLRAVDGVSFSVKQGEILGLVGESGCGKSTAAQSIMRLLPPNARIVGGEVWLDGEETMGKDEIAMTRQRGSGMALMFQDPMTSLDPVFSVGEQLVETLEEHLDMTRAQALERAVDLMRQVGISEPRRRLNAYPHELSGGMRQRVALAIAVSCQPRVLIADEPTTALDVTIQAQILRLIRGLAKGAQQTGVVLITHDLGVVAQTCDRVAVMYAGAIVEMADTFSLFAHPSHPYTQALLGSVVALGASRGQLPTIEGAVPDLPALPGGCRFHPRCPRAKPVCSQRPPDRVELPHGGEVACVLYS